MPPIPCSVGCSRLTSPAIGWANLEGKTDSPLKGCEGVYALCRHHYQEIINLNWINVNLLGWEEIPK